MASPFRTCTIWGSWSSIPSSRCTRRAIIIRCRSSRGTRRSSSARKLRSKIARGAASDAQSMTINGAGLLKRYGFMTALLLPAIFLLIFDERFRGAQNLSNVLAQSSIVGVVSIGMTLVMILGGFDLSVGAVAALSGLCAVVVFDHGDPLHM